MKLLSLLFLSLTALPLPAADIVALCIGNNAYPAENELDTPVNDARLMEATLRGLPGEVDVIAVHDADRNAFYKGISQFKTRARGARLALIFYSGHGLDNPRDDGAAPETYLIPIDAQITDPDQLESQAVPLARLMEALAASGATAKVAVLDCCRSNVTRGTKSFSGTKNLGTLDQNVRRNLGAVPAAEATLIAFATSPGRKAAAFITESDENSPFTKYLTDYLKAGGLSLRDTFERAADATEDATEKLQVPYVRYDGASRVLRDMILVPGNGTPPQPVVARMMPPALPTLPDPAVVKEISPASATKDKPFINELGMKFVPVLTYQSGKKVLFSIWETRRQDYAAYASSVSGVDSEWKAEAYHGEPVGQGNDHPVVSVNWEDATAYCQWLTKRERAAGWIGAGDEYRLPTDLEWSYAVGIGDKEDASASPKDKSGKLADIYPWGTGFPPRVDSGNYADNVNQKTYKTTVPVGSYESNPYGLFDLGGNVWEWCVDKLEESSQLRVLRGDSWFYSSLKFLPSSHRGSRSPETRFFSIGFRCVLEVSGR